jgi:hypothetical protein
MHMWWPCSLVRIHGTLYQYTSPARFGKLPKHRNQLHPVACSTVSGRADVDSSDMSSLLTPSSPSTVIGLLILFCIDSPQSIGVIEQAAPPILEIDA